MTKIHLNHFRFHQNLKHLIQWHILIEIMLIDNQK